MASMSATASSESEGSTSKQTQRAGSVRGSGAGGPGGAGPSHAGIGGAVAATQGVLPGRTLAILLDGTTNIYDADNTNVAKLFQLLEKNDPSRQLCYYQPGIGTYTSPTLITPITKFIAEAADSAVAWYFSAHVTSAYSFICDHYTPSDRICLFGFSRGAYTARALAGMIEKVGLISAGNAEMLNFAWDLYKRTDTESIKLARTFKQTFARDAAVDFVGVWDTVSSVGGLISRHFPYTATNNSIRIFRHAISLDERRVKFAQNRFHSTAPDTRAAEKDPEFAGYLPAAADAPVPMEAFALRRPATDVEEVYFSGFHSSVGGGDEPDTESAQASNIPLHWMITKILQAPSCGIVFHQPALSAFLAAYSTSTVKLADGRVISASAQARILDSLWNFGSAKDTLSTGFWWLLELFPFRTNWQDPQTKVWHRSYRPHLGRPRHVAPGSRIHRSVKDRMESTDYKPKPRLPENLIWVEE